MIILSTGSLYPYGLERIFRIAKKSGFCGIELLLSNRKDDSAWDYWDKKNLSELEKKFKIKIVTIHTPLDFEIYPDQTKNILKLVSFMKAKHFIFHIPKKDQHSYLKWFNSYLINKKLHRSIVAENMGVVKGLTNPIFLDTKELSKLPKLCFDVSHAMESKQDPIKMITELPNIVELHLSNCIGAKTHLNILDNRQLFRKILKAGKNIPIKCVELSPQAFSDFHDEDRVTKLLKETKFFLENC